MKILYNSCHSILEYDEVKLFTEMGHDVFSMGAYSNGGQGHYMLPRPSIGGMKEYPEYLKISTEHARTNLPGDFFNNFDVIINMHQPEFITEQWDRMRHKRVIWRSIGQSLPHVENSLRKMRLEGLKVVRMSPMEQYIPESIGEDAMIRFYKDPIEWTDWNGSCVRAINFTQTLKGRRDFCHYDHIMPIINGSPALIYGSGNEDLGGYNGGELPYELMRGTLRDSRVFVYGGTWPSPYTLAFEEAFMTGIPMVCIGRQLAEEINAVPQNSRVKFYEIPDFIEDGVNGFISDDIQVLRTRVHELLEDHVLAQKISANGRQTAIKIFGKETIKKQWEDFFATL